MTTYYKFIQSGPEIQSILTDVQEIQKDTSYTADLTGNLLATWIKYQINTTGGKINHIKDANGRELSIIEKTVTLPEQINSDWNATDGKAQILNKPTLAAVATSGSYNDLSNKPTIPAAQVNSDWNATSGKAQILNKPTIPAAQVNSDWNATSGKGQILNKPTLAAVATSGSYNDLSNKPTLAAVATSGSYNDLSDKPIIPTTVQSDWNQTDTSKADYIKNKPTIPTKTSQLTNDSKYAVLDNSSQTGNFYATGFWASSDRRLKTNIKDFEYNKSILNLKVFTYDFKEGPKNQIGCMAQDLEELYPELVTKDDSGKLSIQENKLVYLLIEEIKNLKKEINTLKEKVGE